MRLGVIVPARAPVPYLGEALASVLGQEPAPDSVVVVDHASQPALDAPDGVRLVRVDDAGGGPAAARAAGLDALEGCDWVALADADDVWDPGKLGAQLEAVERHPGAAVCFGRARVVDARGRVSDERLPTVEPGLHEALAFIPALYRSNPIPASSALIRADALRAVGGFNAGLRLPAASDWELWLRLARAGHSFLCVPGASIRYRRHAAGLTADVKRLGAAGLVIHEEFDDLVDAEVARDAMARDLETIARGRVRERRYAGAREALTAAAALRRPRSRERLLRGALRIPGVRAALGRRDPYR